MDHELRLRNSFSACMASLASSAFTSIMNRMVVSPLNVRIRDGRSHRHDGSHRHEEWPRAGSTSLGGNAPLRSSNDTARANPVNVPSSAISLAA